MNPLLVIDSHAHVFPDKIAVKASSSIGRFYDLPMNGDGRVESLVNRSTACGITRSVVFSTATRAEQVEAINEFIGDTIAAQPGLTGLGTMHPGLSAAAVRSAAGRIRTLGMKGIKLHPDFQELYPDADDMDPIFRAALDNGLCMVFHAGDHRHPYSHPARIATVAARYPELPIVAAHMGGWSQWDIAYTLLSQFRNVHVDTSSTMRFISEAEMVRLIRIFGADRVLFGSDYPMWDPCDELQRFLALPLSEKEQTAILWDNPRRFFRIDG